MSKQNEMYSEITKNIIAALENVSDKDWKMPWNSVSTMPCNYQSKAYRGINIMQLWASQINNGFASSQWYTYNQSKKMGCQVKGGSKGTKIFFFSIFEKENSAGDMVKIPNFKVYTVFNRDQIEGLEPEEAVEVDEKERFENCEAFLSNCDAEIKFGGDKAYYSPSGDFVMLPKFEDFVVTESYYSTAFHELGHWTGHKSRLSREFGSRFGDEKYAFEELVAELTSAFLCGEMGIQNNLQHPEYIKNWIKVLKDDDKAIITAAREATKACDLLNKKTFEKEEA